MHWKLKKLELQGLKYLLFILELKNSFLDNVPKVFFQQFGTTCQVLHWVQHLLIHVKVSALLFCSRSIKPRLPFSLG